MILTAESFAQIAPVSQIGHAIAFILCDLEGLG